MDPTGNQVLLGYADGVVRLFALESESDPTSGGGASSMYKLTKALSARYLSTLVYFIFFNYLLTYFTNISNIVQIVQHF